VRFLVVPESGAGHDRGDLRRATDEHKEPWSCSRYRQHRGDLLAETLHQERLAKTELNRLMTEDPSENTKSIRPGSASHYFEWSGYSVCLSS
jgi:hypothetical protein